MHQAGNNENRLISRWDTEQPCFMYCSLGTRKTILILVELVSETGRVLGSKLMMRSYGKAFEINDRTPC